MKFATISRSLVLGLAGLLAANAFAASKGSMQVQENVTIAGTKLAPGDYKVQWDGTGPNVEVSILKGKNVVAKVPAHVVDLSLAAPSDSLVVSSDGGSRTVSQIRFSGKKFALAVGDDTAKAGMSSNSSQN